MMKIKHKCGTGLVLFSSFSWLVAKYPQGGQKSYLEANGHSASQEITHRLRNPEVTYRANKTRFCSLRLAA